jgi:hypothetical protein
VWLQKVDPKTDGAARDWVAIYDECRWAQMQLQTGKRLCRKSSRNSSACSGEAAERATTAQLLQVAVLLQLRIHALVFVLEYCVASGFAVLLQPHPEPESWQ